MMDVAFTQSFTGSLKFAQHYGEGKYPGGVCSFVFGEGEKKPSVQEIRQMQKERQKKMRENWERAVPLGGDPSDVICLAGVFSQGDIRGDGLSEQRTSSLSDLYACFPEVAAGWSQLLNETKQNLETLFRRAEEGEALRVWYSNSPDDACGLCWLMAQIRSRMNPLPEIILVKLPEMVRDGETIFQYRNWGEVPAENLGLFLSYSETAIPAFVTGMTCTWQRLQKQNTQLRAVINGTLQGVPENFYDSFIEEILADLPEEFKEPALVGGVIGQCQLGIGDLWIAQRIEKMIADGKLIALTDPKPGDRLYARMLKKLPE